MDGEVNNPTARIAQDVKRDERDEQDETRRDRRTRWTHWMDAGDGRIGWTYWMDARDGRDGQDRRRQHKEGKGLRRVRGKDEGTNQRVGGGEAKRREQVNR